MLQYIDIQEGDEIIRVEVDSTLPRGEVEAAAVKELVKQTRDTLSQAITVVRVSAETFIKMINCLSDKPSKVEVEFGLKLDAEAGPVVAKASTGAHYKVTLCWELNRTGRNGTKD